MSVGTTAPAAAQGNLGGYIERAPIPIAVWERNVGGFRLADLNRAARALRVAAEQDLLPALGEDLRRCADEQGAFRRELPGLGSGGHVRDLIATGVAIGPDRVLLHVLDVTAQRATEHRLRQSEERYRTLIQAANEGVWLVDEQGVSIFANQRVARLLGRSAEEILASRIADFVTERDRARVLAAVATPREARQPFVATFQHRDGRALTCLVSVAAVGSPEARPATLCVLSDMTALKREQDLRLESERRYQRIVETAHEGVWSVDPSGMTTLVNDRMAEMLGTTRAEIEGRPFSEFAGDPTTVAAVGRSMEMDGRPLRVELGLVRADGSHI